MNATVKRDFTQRDVRQGAESLFILQRVQKLDRPAPIVREAYVDWLDVRKQYHHEHAFEEECDLYIRNHAVDLRNRISIPSA